MVARRRFNGKGRRFVKRRKSSFTRVASRTQTNPSLSYVKKKYTVLVPINLVVPADNLTLSHTSVVISHIGGVNKKGTLDSNMFVLPSAKSDGSLRADMDLY